MKKKLESIAGWLFFWVVYIIFYPIILLDKYFPSKSQKEDTKTMEELLHWKQDKDTELLSEFCDLMNEHGVDSGEVKDFMKKYKGDYEEGELD